VRPQSPARLNPPQDFFTLANFKTLVEWMNRRRATGVQYSIGADGIVRDANTGRGVRVLPIPDLDDEPLDLIWEYRRAD